jgi:uncharacterized protein (TIGR00288 family)
VTSDDERIALFLDYENLAIGARDALGGALDFRPIADALAERGRVVVRRAYADWSYFEEDRRMLTRHQVELIEIPQRMGMVRKNAADIKMAVDAIELSFERDYITTFVLGTGDSDFTPLVHKLRELNKRVIGIGVEASTSALLPAACDEFLFYERLEGVEPRRPAKRVTKRGSGRAAASARSKAEAEPEPEPEVEAVAPAEETDLDSLVTRTLAGLARSTNGTVLASMLKRAILRKEPTFSEADHGFRTFGELLRTLADRGVVEVHQGSAPGDPEVTLPTVGGDEDAAFALLRATVERLAAKGPVHLSGLKTQVRKQQPDFSEKRFGYGTFLQFVRAARARDFVEMERDADADDYVVRPGAAAPAG